MSATTEKPAPFATATLAASPFPASMTGTLRAWAHLGNCAVAASIAQLELLRSLTPMGPDAWKFEPYPTPQPGDAHAALRASRQRFDDAIKRCRRINDDLAGGLFTAAELMLEDAPPVTRAE
jgi:hypothetical protein